MKIFSLSGLDNIAGSGLQPQTVINCLPPRHFNFDMKVTNQLQIGSCKKFLLFIFFLFFSFNSFALSPETRLADETQETRAMNLFLEVKCLVCQGQAIESSNTEFSQEMRKLIREKISDGKTDEEIRKELIKEFGEDVLIVQPENNFTLWLLPFIFSALLAVFFFNYFRK